VIPFHVPPLRDRREDIPLLAEYFMSEFTTAYGRKRKEFTPEGLRVLAEYNWPGNVRELRNMIERIVIMNPQVRIDGRHVPLQHGRRSVFQAEIAQFGSLQEARESAEREFILKKLEEARGNVSRAAELLGLERSHLYKKMRALGIAGAAKD
jgi:two-component system, NtrC family, nitrogen regulation response regulator NtrX